MLTQINSRSTLFHSFQIVESKSRRYGVKVRNSTFECFATDRFQAILFRARPAMKQRKENSNDTTRPNWHFRFLRCAFFSNLGLVLHVARLLYSTFLPLWRKAKSEKRDIRSLSRKRRARSRCLFFLFFFPFHLCHRIRHWRIQEDIHEHHYIIQFYRFKYSAKRLKTARCFYMIFKRE